MNEKTIEEIKERLKGLDELTILELLDVTSEELVEFLTDQVEERYDILIEYLDDERDED
jgi:hypothetical protein